MEYTYVPIFAPLGKIRMKDTAIIINMLSGSYHHTLRRSHIYYWTFMWITLGDP